MNRTTTPAPGCLPGTNCTPGPKMPSTVRVGKGRAAMGIKGATAAELRKQVEDMLGPALALLEREAHAFKAEKIDPVWPNATGRSAKAWHVATFVEPNRVGVSLANTSGYAQYVRSARFGRQLRPHSYRNAFGEARKAFTRMTRDLRPVVRDELAKHLEGLSRGR